MRPLREYAKASRATTSPLEMVGYDMQLTAPDADKVLAADLRRFGLKLRNAELREAILAAVAAMTAAYSRLCCTRSVNETDIAQTRTAVDQLLQMMRKERRAFEEAHGAREVSFVECSLRNVRADAAAKVFVAARPEGGVAAKFSDMTAYSNLREQQNVENLRWLLREGYPGRKIIVWAQNVHVTHAAFGPNFDSVRRQATWGDLIPAGRRLKQRLGDGVYTIGFTSHSGEDRWINAKQTTPIPPAGPESLENVLVSLNQPYVFADLGKMPTGLRRPIPLRILVPVQGSATASADGIFVVPVLPSVYDGILFIRDARGASLVS